MAKVAVSNKNPSVAVCTFGMLLENTENLSSPLCSETIIKFSKRKGYFNKAVALVSLYDIEPLIPKILKEKDGELAASIIAAKAYQNLMYENIDMRAGAIDPGAEPEPQKNKKGKKKKNKNNAAKIVAAPSEINISLPEALFNSRSKKTQYLAILGAAYSMQKKYAEQIKAVKDSSGEIMSAKVLFKTLTGEEVTDAEIKKAFGRSLNVNKPIKGASSYLSQVDMNVPALSTLVDALGRLKDSKYLPMIHKAMESSDERVRIDAVRAARRIGDKTSLPYIYKLLKRCEWTVLIEACHFLGEVPDKYSIPLLIDRFEAETGRFRLDVNYALSSIAGQKIGYKPEQWAAWWKTNQVKFEVDEAKSKEFRAKVRLQDAGAMALGGFYSINIFSDRCCFVLDYSKSMNGEKIASLKENMNDTIDGLNKYVEFNISEFGGDVNIMYEGALVNNKKKAIEYVNYAELTTGTRSMDAIERGMMLPGVDTIYFLSDGAPVRGQLSEWETIHKLIRMMNRYRYIAVSTICFYAGPGNARKMGHLANENYGHAEEIDN